MGLVAEDILLVHKHLARLPRPLTALEFGNQHIYVAEPPAEWYPRQWINPSLLAGMPAGPMYRSLGFDYACFDLNDLDGAHHVDLAAPLPDQWKGWASLVTDFGTGEHVRDLWQCQKNAWDALKVGGVCVQANPEAESWPDHGVWYRQADFYSALESTQDGFEVLDVARQAAMGNTTDGWNIRAAWVKHSNVEFMTRAEFDANIPVFESPSAAGRAQTW